MLNPLEDIQIGETLIYGEKYKGSVSEKESMITPENGFVLIETLDPGVSPLSIIEERDKRYEQMAKK